MSPVTDLSVHRLSAEVMAAQVAGADGAVADMAIPVPFRPPSPRFPYAWPPREALLALLVASRTALSDGLAVGLGAWGERRGYWSPEQAAAAATALREAVVNAVVHGNLGLPGLDAFASEAAYFAAVEAGIADDERALYPVAITIRRAGGLLVAHIDDCGRGYRPALLAPKPDGVRLSGRGHALMRAFAFRVRVSCGGRRISLGFLSCVSHPPRSR